jgi:hypothetical protein
VGEEQFVGAGARLVDLAAVEFSNLTACERAMLA